MADILGVCVNCSVVKEMREEDIEQNALCTTCEGGTFRELNLEKYL